MKRTILITGASSGIGIAAARLFAAKDWNVIATMRDPGGATDLGPEVLVTRLDVQDRDSIAQAIEEGVARFGRIDVLLNNAGYGQSGLFEAISREQVQAQFDVNVFGVMDVTRAILPHFRKNKSGLIINVSSGAGLFTLPMISLYCASKFALEGFTEALSYELASQNIVVKSIIPHGGVTATRFSEKSSAAFAKDPQLGDYDAFVTDTQAAFASMIAAQSMSAEDVADVIYGAATDGSSRLRYLIGDDARGFVKARREMPEDAYIDFMRAYFRPRA